MLAVPTYAGGPLEAGPVPGGVLSAGSEGARAKQRAQLGALAPVRGWGGGTQRASGGAGVWAKACSTSGRVGQGLQHEWVRVLWVERAPHPSLLQPLAHSLPGGGGHSFSRPSRTLWPRPAVLLRTQRCPRPAHLPLRLPAGQV